MPSRKIQVMMEYATPAGCKKKLEEYKDNEALYWPAGKGVELLNSIRDNDTGNEENHVSVGFISLRKSPDKPYNTEYAFSVIKYRGGFEELSEIQPSIDKAIDSYQLFCTQYRRNDVERTDADKPDGIQ